MIFNTKQLQGVSCLFLLLCFACGTKGTIIPVDFKYYSQCNISLNGKITDTKCERYEVTDEWIVDQSGDRIYKYRDAYYYDRDTLLIETFLTERDGRIVKINSDIKSDNEFALNKIKIETLTKYKFQKNKRITGNVIESFAADTKELNIVLDMVRYEQTKQLSITAKSNYK